MDGWLTAFPTKTKTEIQHQRTIKKKQVYEDLSKEETPPKYLQARCLAGLGAFCLVVVVDTYTYIGYVDAWMDGWMDGLTSAVYPPLHTPY